MEQTELTPDNVETFPEGTPEPTEPLGPVVNRLYPKILAIMEAVERIPKLGRNTQGAGYDYLREADMMDAVRKEMLAQKVIRLPLVYKSSGTAKDAHVTISSRWVDAESGDFHEITLEGFDVNGQNKASWAGYTGAIKYELRHMIMVPTGDDPEKDSGTESAERGSSPSPSRGAGKQPSRPSASSSEGRKVPEEDAEILERLSRNHESMLNVPGEWGGYPSEFAFNFLVGTDERPGAILKYREYGSGMFFSAAQSGTLKKLMAQIARHVTSKEVREFLSAEEQADLLGGE